MMKRQINQTAGVHGPGSNLQPTKETAFGAHSSAQIQQIKDGDLKHERPTKRNKIGPDGADQTQESNVNLNHSDDSGFVTDSDASDADIESAGDSDWDPADSDNSVARYEPSGFGPPRFFKPRFGITSMRYDIDSEDDSGDFKPSFYRRPDQSRRRAISSGDDGDDNSDHLFEANWEVGIAASRAIAKKTEKVGSNSLASACSAGVKIPGKPGKKENIKTKTAKGKAGKRDRASLGGEDGDEGTGTGLRPIKKMHQ